MYPSLFLMLVFAVGHEGLHVHGPSGPLVAQLGGSVLLPCFIESPLPLEDLQVEWRKMDSDSLVSLFQQGKSRPDLQSRLFRDRVDFFPDEVSKGNFSVLLKNFLKEEAGGYRCKINVTNVNNSVDFVMEIKVIEHFVVRGADRAVFANEGQQAILNCSVDSHVPASEIEEVTWKKTDRDQDILVLLYQDGEILPDSSHERYRGRVELFSSEITKGNFSLKLMNIRMEDKGEFLCEVYTSNMSAHTIVVLQGVGFSGCHILILVLCSVALVLALGCCGPVLYLLRKKVTFRKGMKWHISLIICPNICMFVAFCLWSTEGILSEVIACSVVSIMRPVMLMKTSPYLDRLPRFLQNAVKDLAVPLYHLIITLGAYSYFFEYIAKIQTLSGHSATVLAVSALLEVIVALIIAFYGLRMHLTVCLEMLNAGLLGVLFSNSRVFFDYTIEITSVIAPQIVGMMIVLILQIHLFQGKPFECVHIALSTVVVVLFGLSGISIFILIGISTKDYTRVWNIPFEVVLFIIAWLAVICLLRCHRRYSKGCCSQWRKIGYLCCAAVVAFLITTHGATSLHYVNIIMEVKDRAGYLALTALVHVLAATCLFKHPKYLPDFLQIMIYLFGAVGLSAANAIILATELVLKAGKGARITEDLSVIVLSLETVFGSAWLTLQIYDAWMRMRDRIKHNFEDARTTGPEVVPEMQVLSVQSS